MFKRHKKTETSTPNSSYYATEQLLSTQYLELTHPISKRVSKRLGAEITKQIGMNFKKILKGREVALSIANTLITSNDHITAFIQKSAYVIHTANITKFAKEALVDQYCNGLSNFTPQLLDAIFAQITTDQAQNHADLALLLFSDEEQDNCFAVLNDMVVEKINDCMPVDYRQHYTDERLQRRYDSLARLLSMKKSFSVCSAVTIVYGKLLIAANSGGEASSSELAMILMKKLAIIRKFLNTLLENQGILINDTVFSELVEIHLDELIDTGGTFQNRDLLSQAMVKLARATIPGREPASEHFGAADYFSESECNAILHETSYDILLPEGKKNVNDPSETAAGMTSFEITSDLMKTVFYPFSGFPTSVLVKHFHAEQLIIYYLLNAYFINLHGTEDDKIRLGISKLCCKTCDSVIRRYANLQTRGTHNVLYESTVDLLSKTVSPAPTTPTKLKSPTAAVSSPFFSPGAPDTNEQKNAISIDAPPLASKSIDFPVGDGFGFFSAMPVVGQSIGFTEDGRRLFPGVTAPEDLFFEDAARDECLVSSAINGFS